MRSLYILVVLGLIPLSAQTSIDDSAKIEPAAPPDYSTVNARPDPTATTISPENALPAPIVREAKLDRFTVSPGTVRQGFIYREGAKTVVTLTIPAAKPFALTVISSAPEMLDCEPILFLKGQQEQRGRLNIKWKNVHHDTQVNLKLFDPDHPETVLHSRLYLRINPQQAGFEVVPGG